MKKGILALLAFLVRDVFVDGLGGSLARAHGADDRGGAADDVPAGVDPLDMLVCIVSSSTTMVFHRVVSSPSVVRCMMGFGVWPMAMTTVSTSILNSDPSMGMGRLRPESSGSPSRIRMHSICLTKPRSSPMNLTGLVRSLKMTPSSSAFPLLRSVGGPFFSGFRCRSRRGTLEKAVGGA